MEARSDTINLDALIDEVLDERTFVAFVQALANDFAREKGMDVERRSSPYKSGSLGWENGTVEAVLGAAAAWGQAKLLTESTCQPNPWQRCARILYAGKFYE